MHDCSVRDGDRWLAKFTRRLLRRHRLGHSAVFIVFDEGSRSDDSAGGGHTVALAVGATVKRGVRLLGELNHYNLLRTIEDALKLPHLGSSGRVHPIRGIWR